MAQQTGIIPIGDFVRQAEETNLQRRRVALTPLLNFGMQLQQARATQAKQQEERAFELQKIAYRNQLDREASLALEKAKRISTEEEYGLKSVLEKEKQAGTIARVTAEQTGLTERAKITAGSKERVAETTAGGKVKVAEIASKGKAKDTVSEIDKVEKELLKIDKSLQEAEGDYKQSLLARKEELNNRKEALTSKSPIPSTTPVKVIWGGRTQNGLAKYKINDKTFTIDADTEREIAKKANELNTRPPMIIEALYRNRILK